MWVVCNAGGRIKFTSLVEAEARAFLIKEGGTLIHWLPSWK